CGARDEDAGAIGFDEGPKPPMWTDRFEERGIAVTRDVLREEAVAVLREYAATGGEIYNARGGD
nr:nucleoside deaminase [Rubrobacter sp.]